MVVNSCEETDSVPPDVRILTPQNDSEVSEIVDVTVMSSDNEGVSKVELWIDGVYSEVQDNSEPYSLLWNTTTYEDSSFHILVVRSYDKSNNITDSDPVSVMIDNSNSYPTSVILNPISYLDETFLIQWSRNFDPDFSRYQLFQSTGEEMDNPILIYDSNSVMDTSTIITGVMEGSLLYYQLTVVDNIGLKSVSNIRIGNSNSWFVKDFGGEKFEEGSSIIETLDGGFIITGTTTSFGDGNYDVFLVKTDLFGNEEWSQTFGGTQNDFGKSIEQTDDHGFIIFGWTWSSGNGYGDLWMIKTDPQGNEEWNKTFGGSNTERGWSGHQTTDGGYVVVGEITSFGNGQQDVWLIKTDSQGNEEWNRTFGGSLSEIGYSVQQTRDGGFIITGSSNGDIWLIKTDSLGDMEWDQYFGGDGNELGLSVRQTTDDGFIVTGSTNSFGNGFYDFWLIKTDVEGIQEWTQTYGGNTSEFGQSVRETSDGGYIITGGVNSYFLGRSDLWLIKTDSEGEITWDTYLRQDGFEYGYSVNQVSDGGYVVTGSTSSNGHNINLLLVKTDSEGTTVPFED